MLGSLCLVVTDPCLLDRACLRPRDGCSCWERTLFTGGVVRFAFLPPGEYVLTLARGTRRMVFRVVLAPGGNVVLCCALGTGRWRWSQDRFHTFFNAPLGRTAGAAAQRTAAPIRR